MQKQKEKKNGYYKYVHHKTKVNTLKNKTNPRLIRFIKSVKTIENIYPFSKKK